MTEIMSALFSFGKMPLTIMTESRRNLRQMKSVRSWILRLLGGREADIIALQKEGYGKQRCWIRGDANGGNNEGGEGFIDLSEAEQMALPFN